MGDPARSYQRRKTYEDASITEPAERLRVFGQEDHVRNYGPDYVDRLREAGFAVTETRVPDLVSRDDAQLMGLTHAAGEIFFSGCGIPSSSKKRRSCPGRNAARCGSLLLELPSRSMAPDDRRDLHEIRTRARNQVDVRQLVLRIGRETIARPAASAVTANQNTRSSSIRSRYWPYPFFSIG